MLIIIARRNLIDPSLYQQDPLFYFWYFVPPRWLDGLQNDVWAKWHGVVIVTRCSGASFTKMIQISYEKVWIEMTQQFLLLSFVEIQNSDPFVPFDPNWAFWALPVIWKILNMWNINRNMIFQIGMRGLLSFYGQRFTK